ncbi:MAG: 6-carboxytetrahydropterin synthase [Gemmatimonadetes bacterium]|nr:6-carboxytetrahydropterin synthase [Gemmatimonadota bacterium]
MRLSDEENVRIFGKCNNPHGHGHNYELEVTVRGPVDEKTGTVIDMGRFDEVLQKEVVDRYDHRHLNRDLEEFRTVNPTSEELLRVIWKRLLPCFDTPSLYRIRLVETSKNAFEYYGEEDR